MGNAIQGAVEETVQHLPMVEQAKADARKKQLQRQAALHAAQAKRRAEEAKRRAAAQKKQRAPPPPPVPNRKRSRVAYLERGDFPKYTTA